MADEPEISIPVGGYRNAPGVSATPPGLAPSQPPAPSGGVVSVDTATLNSAAADFKSASGSVSTLYQTLTGTLNGNDAGGDPWGNDSLGQSFGAQYGPASTSALKALQGLSTLLDDIATALTGTTQTFTQGDDINSQIATTKA
jgi:hypothetical protein